MQDIPNGGKHLTSDDLEWTPIGNENIQDVDLCATIPLERLSHFVKGEDLLDSAETIYKQRS